MFCKKCGEAYVEGERVCRKCGHLIDSEAKASAHTHTHINNDSANKNRENSSKKGKLAGFSRKRNRILISFFSFALFIVLVFVIGNMGKRNANFELITNPLIKYDLENSTVFFGEKNTMISFEVPGSTKYSLDNSKAAFLGTDKSLFYIDGKEKVKIADNVIDFAMADGGMGVAYITNFNEADNTGELMLYDFETKKFSLIVQAAYIRSLLLSPDGKTVAYCAGEAGAEGFAGYLSVNGGDPVKLGDNMKYIAVSDNGEFLYFLTYLEGGTSNLSVRRGNEEIKLIEAIAPEQVNHMYLNMDYNEFIFDNDVKTYISVDGKERLKVNNDVLLGILSPEKGMYAPFSKEGINICRVRSFADKVLKGERDLYYLKRDFESFKVVTEFRDAVISNDGKSIIYEDNSGSLYRIKKVSRENSEVVKISRGSDADISIFRASPNLSQVYYINGDRELWFIKNGKDSYKVQDDVNPGFLEMKGKNAFYLSETMELFFTRSGTKKTALKTDKEVYALQSNVNWVMYYIKSGSTKDVFISKGNENFSKLIEDVKEESTGY